ncbi:uncharacterized protein LOC128642298 isoform X2 [Bombina bombina]|uniref:uncharacterized protein LOC128642298 isoform X1 n=1 Tax=Bombina bombina TaxID=8345 RepID=UPI00235B1C7F|nr:uncharacterized protein LOC128642298 isoform X1 [Bombina bombina]XP_053550992.1 uncharacterized protein LOC128642298 isoform X2 [Bombina bombina]
MGKPQILEPVKSSLSPYGEILYSLTLQKFYPTNINISWTRKAGNLHKTIPAIEKKQKNTDGTLNVCSEVKIPEDHMKDPSFSVQATWEHESLDTAGSKTLAIKDFIWKPKVEEIKTSLMLHKTPFTLQCNISQYFPDALTVIWLRREEGSQEVTAVTDRPDIKSHRDQDNTYSCTTSLTVTPTLSTDQGAEYICRVQHPTLVQSIERSTGNLIVMAKPQFMESIKYNTDSSQVIFSLNLRRFHPKEIEILWKHGDKLQYQEKDKITITQNSDQTFDAVSECCCPKQILDDPTYKINVTWNHVTLDNPETKILKIKDLFGTSTSKI